LNASALGAAVLTLLVLSGDPDAPVADAASRGDVGAVRTLVLSGADVNAAQGDGMTGLHWAARRGDAPMAAILLGAGADPGAMTRLGAYKPLHLASSLGHDQVVRELLAGGAAVASETSTGVRPIHLAAESGSAEAVRLLLDAGAGPNVPDGALHRTPLVFAVGGNRLHVVALLLDRGADPAVPSRVVDYAGQGARDRVLERERTERMREVREAALQAAGGLVAENSTRSEVVVDPDDPDIRVPGQGDPPGDSTEAVVAAEETETGPAGEDPEEKEEEAQPLAYQDLVGSQGGMTALHLAARDGHREAARLLLQHGAGLDQPTGGDHSTPLLVAIINGNYDLALEFLEAGADPGIPSEDGVAPLYAVLGSRWAPKALYPQPTAYKQQDADYLQVMRALLDAGADPDARVGTHIWYSSFNFDLLGVDFTGATAFWRAAYATDVEAMRLLVDYGADPGLPTLVVPSRRRRVAEEDDPSGLPPAEVGGSAVYPIHAASGVGYGVARAGNSHRHAPGGWLPAVRYLVEVLGADVNQRDHDGFSAVHHAAARGDNELIRYLVEQGADVTFVSRRGQTTVDMANGPQQRVQPFPETIALLESLGAKNNHNCMSC
jgi:ankyrin repeat protein